MSRTTPSLFGNSLMSSRTEFLELTKPKSLSNLINIMLMLDTKHYMSEATYSANGGRGLITESAYIRGVEGWMEGRGVSRGVGGRIGVAGVGVAALMVAVGDVYGLVLHRGTVEPDPVFRIGLRGTVEPDPVFRIGLRWLKCCTSLCATVWSTGLLRRILATSDIHC